MTCNQLREMNTNYMPFEDFTTAERTAMAKHFMKCKPCRTFLERYWETLDRDLGPMTAEQEREAQSTAMGLLAKDLSDPESL